MALIPNGNFDFESEALKLYESDESERLFASARDRFPSYQTSQLRSPCCRLVARVRPHGPPAFEREAETLVGLVAVFRHGVAAGQDAA